MSVQIGSLSVTVQMGESPEAGALGGMDEYQVVERLWDIVGQRLEQALASHEIAPAANLDAGSNASSDADLGDVKAELKDWLRDQLEGRY